MEGVTDLSRKSRTLLDPGIFFFLALLIAVPLGLAIGMVGASWLEAGVAFAAFYLALFLVVGGGKVSQEAVGFTLIFGTATGWLGVPVLALDLRLRGMLA